MTTFHEHLGLGYSVTTVETSDGDEYHGHIFHGTSITSTSNRCDAVTEDQFHRLMKLLIESILTI